MGLFHKKDKDNMPCCSSDVSEQEVTDRSDGKKSDCGCNCKSGCCETATNEEAIGINKTTIKILGSGCKSCITLADNVKAALEEMKIEANIVKVTDFADISGYGVMSTPAMVVNEKVVSFGKVLKPKEVVKLLQKEMD